MKKILLVLVLTTTGFITMPAFAWPEVDHMNMCGPATKVVRTYNGHSQGWVQRDRYLETRGNTYYLSNNCPNTTAPVKKANVAYKITDAKKASKVKSKPQSKWLIERSKRLVVSKRKNGYDEHADCLRVDRLNSYGRPLRAIHKH